MWSSEAPGLCSATHLLCTLEYFELCYTMVTTAKATIASWTISSPLLVDSVFRHAWALIMPSSTYIKRVSMMSSRDLDYLHLTVLPCQLISGKLKSPVRTRIYDTENSSSGLKKASSTSLLLLDRHVPTMVSPLLAWFCSGLMSIHRDLISSQPLPTLHLFPFS